MTFFCNILIFLTEYRFLQYVIPGDLNAAYFSLWYVAPLFSKIIHLISRTILILRSLLPSTYIGVFQKAKKMQNKTSQQKVNPQSI